MPTADLTCTLLSDGSSDRALMPILRWSLHCHLPLRPVQLKWADMRQLPRPPRELHEKIATSLQLYPCDLLFIHRDTESSSMDERYSEIDHALHRAAPTPPAVTVIPVRMMEAWLLIQESAIRRAANNPNGRTALAMPRLREIENIGDPKSVLHELIRKATGLGTHRRDRFDVHHAVHRVADYIEDFSPLRQLSAFRILEEQITTTIADRGWAG